MKELSARLDSWLAQHAPDILADLNPGASESEIQQFMEKFNLIMPDERRD